MTTPSFQHLIETLNRHGVEFIVVGGVAAVPHGAPVTTFDLDALFRVSEDNAKRLLVHASFRGHRPALQPSIRDILAGGHLLLATDAGPLDMLGYIGDSERYEDFQGAIVRVHAAGLQIPILALSDLFRVKRALSRDKDLPAVRLLEALVKGRQQ